MDKLKVTTFFRRDNRYCRYICSSFCVNDGVAYYSQFNSFSSLNLQTDEINTYSYYPELSTIESVVIDSQKQLLYFTQGSNAIEMFDISNGKTSILCGDEYIQGAEDGIGENAKFNEPKGLAFDSTSRILYAADAGNYTIRKVFVDERRVETLTGTPEYYGHEDSTLEDSLFNYPYALCLNKSTMELFVADNWNYVIRKISLEKGIVSTLCGTSDVRGYKDGIGYQAKFDLMNGITIDEKNNYLYVAEDAVIRKVDMSGEEVIVSTLCGCKEDKRLVDGNAEQARFQDTELISFDSTTKNLFVKQRKVVRRIVLH